MNCAKCGADLPDDAYFCPECGTRREGDPPAAEDIPADDEFFQPPAAEPRRPGRATPPSGSVGKKPGSRRPARRPAAREPAEPVEVAEPVEEIERVEVKRPRPSRSSTKEPEPESEAFVSEPEPPEAPPPLHSDLYESQEFAVAPGRGRPKSAPRPPRAPRAPREQRKAAEPREPRGKGLDRQKASRVILAFLIAVIVIGAAVYFLFLRDDEPAPPVATPAATVEETPAPTPTPAITPDPAATVPAGASLSDRDCSDFATQGQAQDFYREAGGPHKDLHGLDADRNGLACDSETDTGA